MDLSPDKHHKKRHVLPGGFIPGPNKPKILIHFYLQDYITFLLYNRKVFTFGMLQKTVFLSLSCSLDSTWQTALVWIPQWLGRAPCIIWMPTLLLSAWPSQTQQSSSLSCLVET
jgi:hypothetical protein